MSEKENRKEHDHEAIGMEPHQPKPEFIDIIANSVKSLQDWRGGGRE